LRGPDDFVLIDITLLPEHRNSGIGAGLVRELIVQANAAHEPLRAHVLKQNPAWRLWQRLGFHLISDDGVYLAIEVPAGSICKP
jgi:ribosomal protein S18 acetylase RimI-like enzyme